MAKCNQLTPLPFKALTLSKIICLSLPLQLTGLYSNHTLPASYECFITAL